MSSEREGLFGFIVAAVGAALALGLLVITATVLCLEVLRSWRGTPDQDLSFYLLAGGTLAGIVVTGASAWRLLAPIHSTYRRGGLALVSAFATVLLMLICIPVNQAFGAAGLLGLLLICAATGTLLARRASQLALHQ